MEIEKVNSFFEFKSKQISNHVHTVHIVPGVTDKSSGGD